MRVNLPHPHPAAGRAPTLEEILLETATLRPPPESIMTPEEQAAVRNAVNNPQMSNVPPELLNEPALRMGHRATSGEMPVLSENVYNELLNQLIRQLDTEGRVSPTIGRSLTAETSEPSVMDLIGQAGSGRQFSDSFGPNPGSDPTTGPRIEQMLERLQAVEPEALGGDRSAIEEMIAGDGGTSPGLERTINDQVTSSSSANQFYALLNQLRELHQMSQGPQGFSTSGKLMDFISNSTLSQDEHINALLAAIRRAGSGQQEGAFDPTQVRSLAPTLNPEAVQGNLEYEGQNDPDLIMRLMGLK